MDYTMLFSVVVVIVFLVGLGVITYLYFRDKSLSEIRADVYQLFLVAEHTFLVTDSGKQKMKYVIQRARALLPQKAQYFITDAFLEKTVQLWFDAVKDLLDDGKYNKSTKQSEE